MDCELFMSFYLYPCTGERTIIRLVCFLVLEIIKMPVCGFNKDMLEGMNRLHQGLIENLLVIKIEENIPEEE